MGKVSEDNIGSSPEPTEHTIYYEQLWQERLDWTGHLIPCTVPRWGLYMEAYVVAPAKPDLKAARQEVAVKIASLPITAHDTIRVSIEEIYPTKRSLRTIKDGNLFLKKMGEKRFHPPAKKVTPKVFEKLEFEMPRSKWTLFELMAMLGQPEESYRQAAQILTKVDLTEQGKKYCLITGRKATAYRIGKVLKVSSTPTTDYKEEALKDLEVEYEDCTLCELGTIRKERGANLVFGRGNKNATGMILAESPWEMEERDKKPLHPEAPAGGVLYRVMNKVGLSQNEWYLTNGVICRPLLNPGAPVSENKPGTRHRQACSTRLKRTLRSVSPKLVVLLGAYAYEAWFGHTPEGGVKRNMGWVTVLSDETKNPVNYLVYFTYHPSYINRCMEQGGQKARDAQVLYLQQWQEIAAKYKELTTRN